MRPVHAQVLTSGPGRKYLPKWTGGGIAYTRGDVDEKRGVRQRVNYVSYGIGFTDGRTDAARRLLQRQLVAGRPAHGVPPRHRRHVAAGHAARSAAIASSPSSALASFRPTRRTAAA